MMKDNLPVVTVSVSAYNSSKYILETLESIKEQTYPYLILRISDDCSTDDTVAVCREWMEKNKDRFVETDIIQPEHNTGPTGNANRGWDACTTTYYKAIAGDDILLPNCIEDNMSYMKKHPETVFVFSKIQVFGDDVEQNVHIEKQFDYTLFQLSTEEQLQRILNGGNFIPASTAFVNVEKIRELGIRHDERIPFLEDMPKWVNVLSKGVKLHFMDVTTVKYRVHAGSLSTSSMASPRFKRQLELYWFYYKFPSLYKDDPDSAVQQAVDREMSIYSSFYDVVNSKKFRLSTKIVNFCKRLLP